MNRAFDYNGVQVAPSKPVQKLRTVHKTVYIDSGDRDMDKYKDNNDFVVYLPRVYEKVVSINIRSAEFPNMGTANVVKNDCSDESEDFTAASKNNYFLLEFVGLNRSDECAAEADRSAYVDSVFAKFQITSLDQPILYNESSGQKNMQYYLPSISKLDRLHIKVRNHFPKGTIRWDDEFSLTLDIETLENSFDDFSSIETRIAERSNSGFYQN
jgi:hypothetical protein